MSKPNPCKHPSSHIQVCISKDCPCPSLDTCALCKPAHHPSHMTRPFQRCIKQKLTSTYQVIGRRKELLKIVSEHFERERRKLKEQQEDIVKMVNRVIEEKTAKSIEDINAGKLVNKNFVMKIFRDQKVFDDIEALAQLEKIEIKLCKTMPELIESHKVVEKRDVFQLIEPPPRKRIVMLREPDDQSSEQKLHQATVPVKQEPINKQKIVRAAPVPTPTNIPQPNNAPPQPNQDQNIHKLHFATFAQAAASTDIRHVRLQIFIDFTQLQECAISHQPDSNWSDFVRWIKTIKRVRKLIIRIGRDFEVNRNCLIQLENAVKVLRKLKEFEFYYTPYRCQAVHPFEKLTQKKVAVKSVLVF